jgi:hypothetical protein
MRGGLTRECSTQNTSQVVDPCPTVDLRRRIPGRQGVGTSGVPIQSAKQGDVYVHAGLKETKY